MRLPICRRGAVVVGVVMVSAFAVRAASAGIVAPLASEQPALVDLSLSANGDESAASASTLAAESQPFWFPGADDVNLSGVSLTAVPVRAQESAGAILPGTQEHPLIPLPPSAWTGMAGLLGLGAVKLLRNARRLLA